MWLPSPPSKSALRNVPLALLILALHLHLLLALFHNFHTALPLLAAFLLGYAFLIYHKFFRQPFSRLSDCVGQKVQQLGDRPRLATALKVSFPTLLLLAFLLWLLVDSSNNRIRLRSLFGFCAFLCLCYSFSAHPFHVKLRPVIGGILLQISLGIFILRWPPGFVAFQWTSEKIVSFLKFTSNGTRFVYGFVASPPPICGMNAVFLFTALQIIIYFGAIVSLLYHFGIMQALLSRVAILVQSSIGTTAAESMNAVACIFLGQTESALLIGPSIASMTESEVHSMMAAGFACIAGSLFSAYISFGACPIHLLSASIMNASISLGVSKLIYPEMEESNHKNLAQLDFINRDEEEGLFECISKSAVKSARFVLAIGANLLVYTALLALLNSLIGWAGSLIGIQGLTCNKLLSFLFFPLAWAMGASDAVDFKVSIDETMKVAELMGVKTVLNEFIAYKQLSEMIATGTLKGSRARMVATYALCGFSNISMIGTQVGVLTAICPERRRTFAKVALRAFVAGVFSCFLTACVAGMLVDTPLVCKSGVASGGCVQLGQLANGTSRF